MLVLSRKVNESIVIGKDITITVLEIKGNRIRLGIEAPKECRVVRSELEIEVSGDGPIEIEGVADTPPPAPIPVKPPVLPAAKKPPIHVTRKHRIA